MTGSDAADQRRDDPEVGLGPGLVQVPRAARRTDDVVAPLNDDSGNVADSIYVVEKLVLSLHESVVHEIVTLDARERKRFVRLVEVRDQFSIGDELERTALPRAPGLCRREPDGFVVAREPAVVGRHDVPALFLGDERDVLFEAIREDLARTGLVEPWISLLRQRNIPRRTRPHALGVRLGVASASVLPHDPPSTSQHSIPRRSRNRSMSATMSQVVLASRLACGVLRPAPRWSKRTMR